MLTLGSIKFPDGTIVKAEEAKIIREAVFESIKKNIADEKQTYAVIAWIFEECKEALEVKQISL